MKMQNITRLLVTRLRGEHHADNSLAQRQLVASKTGKPSKAQAAAELASFRKNISALSTRQLQQLHSRLTKRLGAFALQKLMREAKGKR